MKNQVLLFTAIIFEKREETMKFCEETEKFKNKKAVTCKNR